MSTITASISPKLLEIETSYLVHEFVRVMPSGHTNNFPEKWAWPRSRDPTIIGTQLNISSKLFELVTSKFGKRLWLTIVIWLSGSAYYGLQWGSTVGYPSDSLASCSNKISSCLMFMQILTYYRPTSNGLSISVHRRMLHYVWFLADRTNGRAIATLLRLSSSSVVCLWRYVLWLNGAS